jgi:predicted transcriptional regulator
MPKVKVFSRLSPEAKEKLELLAQSKHWTTSAAIEVAVEEFLAKHEDTRAKVTNCHEH